MARDTRRRLLALAKELEPRFRDAFVLAVRNVQSEAQLRLVTAAIAAGNVEDALRVLQIRPETFSALELLERAYVERGAAYQIESLPKKLQDPAAGARLIVQFQGTQPRASNLVFELGARLITGITNSQRDLIAAVIAEGLEESKPPARIARDLIGTRGATGRRTGGIVGLTERDGLTVQRMRSALASGDPERMRAYLRLEGRNKAWDGAVRRAIEAGEPLTARQIEQRTNHLANRYLRNRANLIARTETIAALNAGRMEATQQLIDRGAVRADQVTRSWDATGDARTRLMHLQMEGQSVPWGQPFVAPDGDLLMHPGDTSLGAGGENTIGCRCYMAIKTDFLAGAI